MTEGSSSIPKLDFTNHCSCESELLTESERTANNEINDISFTSQKLKHMQKTAFRNSCDKMASFIIKLIESQCCAAASFGQSQITYTINDACIIRILKRYGGNRIIEDIRSRFPNLGTFNIVFMNDFKVVITW